MTSASKAKGSAAERAVVKFLQANGFIHAERTRAGWADDRGDIDGLPGVTIEVKAEKRIDLAGYMGELEREMKAGKADTGAVIVKRRGTTNVGAWYAVLPASLWVQLLKEAGR